MNILQTLLEDQWAKELAAKNRERMKAEKTEIRNLKRDHKKLMADAAKEKKASDPYRKASKAELEKIGQAIFDAVANSVPDGDPIDHIIPMLKRMNLECSSETLDKAVKANWHIRNHKTYDKYVSDMWDLYAETQGDDRPNPWK